MTGMTRLCFFYVYGSVFRSFSFVLLSVSHCVKVVGKEYLLIALL